jgi:hypothetical protein
VITQRSAFALTAFIPVAWLVFAVQAADTGKPPKNALQHQ